MAQNASKFVYEIQAQYTGEDSLKKLQDDLDQIGKIELGDKLYADMEKAAGAMKDAEAEAARLKEALAKSFDPKIAGQLDRQNMRMPGLEKTLDAQKAKLESLAQQLEKARKAKEAFEKAQAGGEMGARATQHLAKLESKLLDTERAWQKQADKVQATTERMEQARARIERLNQALAKSRDPQLQKQYDEQNRAVEENRKKLETLTGKYNEARKAMAEFGATAQNSAAKLKALNESTQRAGNLAAARNVLGLPDRRAIESEIAGVRRAYETLRQSGTMTGRDLAQAHLNMLQRTAELERRTTSWTGALSAARGQLVALGAAFAGIGKGMSLSIAFETEMAGVRKTVGGTKEEIRALGNELRKMSLTRPFSPGELAQIAALGGQLGIAKDQITEFTDLASTMGVAFDMSAEEAGNAIGKMTNVFQISMEEARSLGDAINQLGNNTAARERDIVSAMLRIGGTSRQFGIANKNAAALTATMLSLGRAPEVAATAINALLNRLQIANTKPQIAKALESIGISAQDMAKKIQSDPQKALDELLETLSKIEGVERAEVLTNLFGQGFQDDIGVLVGSLDTYKKALKLVGDETKYVGAMQEEARNQSDTTANKLRMMAEALNDIWRTVGDGFKEYLAPFAEQVTKYVLTPFANFIRDSPKLSAAAVGITTIAVALKPLKMLFSTVNFAVKILGENLAKLGSSTGLRGMALWNTAMKDLNLAALGLKGTIATVARALGGLFTAASVGWEIGGILNQFDVVRQAGVALASGLEKAFLRVKLAYAFWTGGDVAAIERQLAEVDRIYGEMFADIARGTDEYKQKQKQAQQEIAKGHKEVTAGAKKGNAEQAAAAKEAAQEAAKAYKKYADEVKRINEDISGRRKSLKAELQDMAAGYIKNDARAWLYQRQRAKEYEEAAKAAAKEARAALAAGDTVTADAKWKEAAQYADDAKEAYKGLNHEVKVNGKVVIDEYTALRGAMNGVKRAGQLGIDILKEQKQASEDAMSALEKQHGLKDLTADMETAERKWIESWRKMGDAAKEQVEQVYKVWKNAAGFWTNTEDEFSAGWSKGVDEFTANWNDGWAKFERQAKDAAAQAKRAIDDAAKDRTTTIRIRTLETKRWGGMVGEALKFSRGGRLPGFGGGDKVSALLERGEFVIRKEAVRRFGAGFFHALNSLKLPPLPDFSAFMPALAATGGAGGSAPGMVLELKLPGGDTVAATVSGPDAERLIRFNRRVSNLRYRK